MTPVLTITDAHKRFDTNTALDGASLVVHQGEWLGLLGPNGAGKSTLIKAIAGRVRLSTGEIRLFGKRLEPDNTQDRSALGVVPQDIALFPTLSARENLRAFAAFHGVSRSSIPERVERSLEWTGLADRADEPVQQFSGGMKRRLNIACGVLHEPIVVLLDEPTVGVDPQSRERIWEMLATLKSQGASLLLTTHQLDEAQTVCERIAIIDHGTMIADGSFDELLAATIGARRRVVLTLDEPIDAQAVDGARTNGCTLEIMVDEVARELPALLKTIAAMNRRVDDISIVSPTLQSVFIHLTGKELRE